MDLNKLLIKEQIKALLGPNHDKFDSEHLQI